MKSWSLWLRWTDRPKYLTTSTWWVIPWLCLYVNTRITAKNFPSLCLTNCQKSAFTRKPSWDLNFLFEGSVEGDSMRPFLPPPPHHCRLNSIFLSFQGSEWNAANFEELQKNKWVLWPAHCEVLLPKSASRGVSATPSSATAESSLCFWFLILLLVSVGYILNVTREIDNFFPESFTYMNIRIYDVEASDLLPHWTDTYSFIEAARLFLFLCFLGRMKSSLTLWQTNI